MFSIPVPTVIEIAPNDDLQTLRNMFMSVEDKLQITAASIDAMVAKSLGEGGSRMNIDAEVRQSLKNSLLRPAAALPVDTKVRQISEQNFLTIDAPVEPSAEIVDLCYRFYTAAGTAMQIAAAVIETEIHFSLGSGESGIELSANADGTAKSMRQYRVQSKSLLASRRKSHNLWHRKRVAFCCQQQPRQS